MSTPVAPVQPARWQAKKILARVAPCRFATIVESWAGIRPPGCLGMIAVVLLASVACIRMLDRLAPPARPTAEHRHVRDGGGPAAPARRIGVPSPRLMCGPSYKTDVQQRYHSGCALVPLRWPVLAPSRAAGVVRRIRELTGARLHFALMENREGDCGCKDRRLQRPDR